MNMNPIKPVMPAPIEGGCAARIEEKSREDVLKTDLSDAANPASFDAVDISSQAEMVNALVARAHLAPDVRMDKIAELKERIASNAYQPSAEEIAQAIIENRE
jgi:flagellar biosynthesis anti-sigma factor FlgM